MKNFFKEHFSFSLSERRGILVLIVLIVLAMLSPLVYKFFYANESKLPDKKLIAELDKALYQKDTVELEKKYSIPENYFDPNDYTKNDWLKIGIKEQVATRIINYLSKGGRFYRKEDLLKIYGFDTSLYNTICPLIEIRLKYATHKNFKRHVAYNKANTTNTYMPIELNSADTTELKKLSGIGSTFSSRIIKYRNLLGGFYSVDQLAEVYGLDKKILENISGKIIIDTSRLKKIDLNTSSEKSLRSHPYIGKYKASAIIKLRNFQKTALNCLDLYTNGILTKDEAEKLKYYLK